LQTQQKTNITEQPAEPAQRHSVSAQMAERFARRRLWRRFIAAAYILLLIIYLLWRFTIINPVSPALSITYYVTECIAFILGLTAIFNSWHYNHRTPPPAPEGLSVDVFVPTYKEPLDIIRRTVMAAKAIRYPHGTFLLDDGKRDEVKALAEELGVTYLRRPDSKHAKAGNINHALQHSKADFVMTFDADHIALPHALDVMLGFFDDENVVMVQTPQDYYNTDAFQYLNARRTGGLWHDQSAFYNIAEPCADASNAASCVGTGVVYRRSALDKIGGIPCETVTEDIHTSLKLHKAGYQTVFLNEPIAYGIAAADLGEYYKTRHRWGHGNLHALRHENILFCKGLTWRQRLHYLSLGLIYLEGWQQLLLFIIPVVALIWGLQPFTITVFNMLIVLSFPVLSYLLLQELGCGFSRYWANELFSMARWPVYLTSTAGLFGKKISFNSSSKNIQGKTDWRMMVPQLTVTIISLLAVFYGVIRLTATGFPSGPLGSYFYLWLTTRAPPAIDIYEVMPRGYTVELVAIAGFWALYNALRGIFFMRKVLHDAKNTHDFFRFRIPVPVLLNGRDKIYGHMTALSEDWAALRIYKGDAAPFTKGKDITLTAFMPAGALQLTLRVENITQENGGNTVAGSLIWTSAADRDQLANGLYSVDWHREFLHRSAYFLTPSDLLLSCLRLHPVSAHNNNDWQAVLLQTGGDGFTDYGILIRRPDRRQSLIVFSALQQGQHYNIMAFTKDGTSHSAIKVAAEEHLHSLVEKGLDGAAPHRYIVTTVA
jgi:cellulose synthase (UDP-forming)